MEQVLTTVHVGMERKLVDSTFGELVLLGTESMPRQANKNGPHDI